MSTKSQPSSFRTDNLAISSSKLLYGCKELAEKLGISLRTLRRMCAAQEIPGQVTLGARVLFQAEVIHEWVRAGAPPRTTFEAMQKAKGGRE